MSKTIQSDFSGHTLFVKRITTEQMPNFKEKESYTTFYSVHNFNAEGWTFMYLGKGHQLAPKQIVVWYRKGAFWESFGKNFKDAIEGAQKDGWKYA